MAHQLKREYRVVVNRFEENSREMENLKKHGMVWGEGDPAGHHSVIGGEREWSKTGKNRLRFWEVNGQEQK